jgi:hypothetical protein
MQVTPLFRKRHLLYQKSPHDQAFFTFLVHYFGYRYTIVPQVEIVHLIEPALYMLPPDFVSRFFDFTNVDFVFYDRTHPLPVLAMDVHGAAHQQEWRKKQHEGKMHLLHSAGLPLLIFKAKNSYGQEDLERIERELAVLM